MAADCQLEGRRALVKSPATIQTLSEIINLLLSVVSEYVCVCVAEI